LPFLLLVVISMTVASEAKKHERWRMSSRGRWPDGGEVDGEDGDKGGGRDGDCHGHG
jgi:hypothetical protein